MKTYTVQVVHQVTETYRVEAESREDAWHRVSAHRPLTDDPEQVRLLRTDHGKREVWNVQRHEEQAASLPVVLGPCLNCGTPTGQCAHGLLEGGVCCERCQHPST